MDHFPIFLTLNDQRVVVYCGGLAAIAKLRLLLIINAPLCFYAQRHDLDIGNWAEMGYLELTRREVCESDVTNAVLFYAASADTAEDQRVADIAQSKIQAQIKSSLFLNLDKLAEWQKAFDPERKAPIGSR